MNIVDSDDMLDWLENHMTYFRQSDVQTFCSETKFVLGWVDRNGVPYTSFGCLLWECVIHANNVKV